MNKTIIIAGLVASVAMAMVEMVYEGIFGIGFWSAPVFISAAVLQSLQAIALPVGFLAVPVLLGIMGHMMNSVILAFVFMKMFRSVLTSPAAGAVMGALYALVVFFIMWLGVLPLIDPIMLNLNPVVFAMSHIVWGAVIGFMVAREASRQTA